MPVAFGTAQPVALSSWCAPAAWRASKFCSRSVARWNSTRLNTPGLIQAAQATQEPKVKNTRVPGLRLAIAAHEIPHPAKASYGGEDAFFITQQGSTAFGVADGVGGWANSGINPAEYSKQLMREAKAHFEEVAMLATPPSESETGSVQTNTGQETDSPASSGEQVATGQAPAASGTTAPDGVTSGSDDTTPSPSGARSASPEATPSSSSSSSSNSSLLSTSGSDEGSSSVAQQSSQSSAPSSVDCNPRTALAAAHKATKQPGSATALILQLREGSTTLKASNLGDSGFALFRTGELVFQSSPLQHFFDCPYQFASCPDFTDDTDRPEDASDYELQLQSGDVIVAATDGLWDNLHTKELLPLLPASESDVKQAALQIASAASNNAFDDQYPSPYTVEAVRQGMDLPWWQKLLGARFRAGRLQLARLTGGKVDDITVVVAYVAAPSA